MLRLLLLLLLLRLLRMASAIATSTTILLLLLQLLLQLSPMRRSCCSYDFLHEDSCNCPSLSLVLAALAGLALGCCTIIATSSASAGLT